MNICSSWLPYPGVALPALDETAAEGKSSSDSDLSTELKGSEGEAEENGKSGKEENGKDSNEEGDDQKDKDDPKNNKHENGTGEPTRQGRSLSLAEETKKASPVPAKKKDPTKAQDKDAKEKGKLGQMGNRLLNKFKSSTYIDPKATDEENSPPIKKRGSGRTKDKKKGAIKDWPVYIVPAVCASLPPR
jgi:hypothetical protein